MTSIGWAVYDEGDNEPVSDTVPTRADAEAVLAAMLAEGLTDLVVAPAPEEDEDE